MAYTKITTEYMVHKAGDTWFVPVNSDGTTEEKVAECQKLSPYGSEVVTDVPPAPIIKPTIGTVTISGTLDVETGTATDLSATFSGDATDVTFKWYSDATNVAEPNPKTLAATKVAGIAEGTASISCKLSSLTASDPSKSKSVSVTVTDPVVAFKAVNRKTNGKGTTATT
jgi:hypothetical protein